MKVIADLCVVPIGQGTSVRKEVAQCENILREAPGVSTFLHGYGTNLEGEWSDVMAAIRRCHEALHESGTVRVSSTLKLGTRTDKAQSVQDKIQAVEDLL